MPKISVCALTNGTPASTSRRATIRIGKGGDHSPGRNRSGETWKYAASLARFVLLIPRGTATYGYDAVGRRTSRINQSGGRNTYGYDALGMIQSETSPRGEITTTVYDAAQRMTLERYADGSRTSFTYDAADRLTNKFHLEPDDSVISGYDYQSDQQGNRIQMRRQTG